MTQSKLTKQEVLIADSTGNTTLTLWEDDLNSLELHECYHITKVNVRVFGGDHGLSFPRFGASTAKIEDIGTVNETRAYPTQDEALGLSIIGVKDLFDFKICIGCNFKIQVTDCEREIIKCTKCNMSQQITQSPIRKMAKLLLEGPNVTMVTLVAYEDMLKVLVPAGDITEKALLECKPFNATYDAYHKITSIGY